MTELFKNYMFPLLAGFFFLNFTHYFRYKYQALKGSSVVLLWAIFAGLIFYSLTHIIAVIGYAYFNGWITAIHEWWYFDVAMPFKLKGVLSVGTALFCGFIFNLVETRTDAFRDSLKDSLDKFMAQAAKIQAIVRIETIGSYQYVGLLKKFDNDPATSSDIAITPILIYRKNECNELVEEEDFSGDFQSEDEESIRTITIKRESVISVEFDGVELPNVTKGLVASLKRAWKRFKVWRARKIQWLLNLVKKTSVKKAGGSQGKKSKKKTKKKRSRKASKKK